MNNGKLAEKKQWVSILTDVSLEYLDPEIENTANLTKLQHSQQLSLMGQSVIAHLNKWGNQVIIPQLGSFHGLNTSSPPDKPCPKVVPGWVMEPAFEVNVEWSPSMCGEQAFQEIWLAS